MMKELKFKSNPQVYHLDEHHFTLRTKDASIESFPFN